ncbi:MAG: hypothetical protein JF589_14995 [Gemmatimonadetes bacterium]|jgi:hypothetical protein|nr:hypothetical protein [Gemmatimonadota bacterium]
MKSSTILRALGAVALLSLAAVPARAQAAAQAGTPSGTAAAGDAWKAIPAGTYHLDIQLPERVMPATLTVTDSSGTPTATLLPEGDQDAHGMKVTVKGTELYLNSQAERGPIEIVLTHKGSEIDGKWAYGPQSGTLKGKQEK